MNILNGILLVILITLVIGVIRMLYNRTKLNENTGAKPVYGAPSESPLAEYGIGSFVWYINGEAEVFWDRGSMKAFGLETEEGVDWYKIEYTDWAKLVASEAELRRLQEEAAVGIAARGPYSMWGIYVDPVTSHQFKVLSWGTAEEIEKDGRSVVKCTGVNVRIPSSITLKEHTSLDVMAQLTRMSDTIQKAANG